MMRKWVGSFFEAEHPVLSLGVQAELREAERERGSFEVLMRHLLHRFANHELVTSDDETKRTMQISLAVAMPGLLLALFLFPAYHAFPPNPLHRAFWDQVGDHYFYVMYAFVMTGAATVLHWDLLFPDLLDVYVLSVLPISGRRLFLARVLAVASFLALVMIGTSVFGLVCLPVVAELRNPLLHFVAHGCAVFASGGFAAASFLMLQGMMLNVFGAKSMARATPVIQAGSVVLLLAVLVMLPTITGSIEAIVMSGGWMVRCFPPFWFLGVYERLLGGAETPAVFSQLARTGCYALLISVAGMLATYPLAYRRRVRALIEGGGASPKRRGGSSMLQRWLHGLLLREPERRAIFHFVGQTMMRAQKQRLMLAMYGGLGLALALARTVTLRSGSGHVAIQMLPGGAREAVPIVAFWVVAGLSTVIASPVDRRGAWLFRVISGRAQPEHLVGATLFVGLWAAMISVATALLMYCLTPTAMRGPAVLASQLITAVGGSIILADGLLFAFRTVPFTHLRKSSTEDLPLGFLRYFIAFPLFVLCVVRIETRSEGGVLQLLRFLVMLGAVHLLMRYGWRRTVERENLDMVPDDTDEFPQRLGLRNG